MICIRSPKNRNRNVILHETRRVIHNDQNRVSTWCESVFFFTFFILFSLSFLFHIPFILPVVSFTNKSISQLRLVVRSPGTRETLSGSLVAMVTIFPSLLDRQCSHHSYAYPPVPRPAKWTRHTFPFLHRVENIFDAVLPFRPSRVYRLPLIYGSTRTSGSATNSKKHSFARFMYSWLLRFFRKRNNRPLEGVPRPSGATV